MDILSKNVVLQRKSYRHKRYAKLIRRALSKAKKSAKQKLVIVVSDKKEFSKKHKYNNPRHVTVHFNLEYSIIEKRNINLATTALREQTIHLRNGIIENVGSNLFLVCSSLLKHDLLRTMRGTKVLDFGIGRFLRKFVKLKFY